ncbi:MAG: hypothetical protein RL013_321, partial [Bacteroidota bacterium]
DSLYGGARKSAIHRGSANRLRMPDADWPCVERLRIRDESRIGRALNGCGYAMNRVAVR